MENLILGIETSCDETAASVTLDGREVLSNVIYSQVDIHKEFGGVVPEISSRAHIEKIKWVIDQSLLQAGVKKEHLTAIAVTNRPGLIGALLVGLSFAKGLAYSLNKPLIPVNHIHGHIAANYITHKSLNPPFVCLVASGGHSHVIRVKDYMNMEVLARTRDDAAGEAFDKAARIMKLGYPGGVLIEKMAKTGDSGVFNFTRPKAGDDFSFSGLKTAVMLQVTRLGQNLEQHIPDVCASFQEAVVDCLCDKTLALISSNDRTLCLAGGVSSNERLREKMGQALKNSGVQLLYPDRQLCTDNAAMISCMGYIAYSHGVKAQLNLNAYSSMV